MRIFVGILLGLFLCSASVGVAFQVPDSKGFVSDYAELFSADQISQFEVRLKKYGEDTSNQIAILTIDSLEESDIESFSITVAEHWGVGQKGMDNGVLIVIAKDDRKMRIEIGRGLEGVLTDLVAGRIVDYIMTPAFKEGKFYEGVDEAIDGIQLSIKGEFDSEAIKMRSEKEDLSGMFLIICFVLVFVAGFASMFHIIFGGIIGALGAPLVAHWMYGPGTFALVLAAVCGFLVGLVSKFILDIALSSSGGGYSSSGGSSSSGGGSFGGGGFSGGGASGGW